MRARMEAIVEAFLAELHPEAARSRELVEELAGHVEEGMRRHMVLGRTPEEALAAAFRDLGSLAPVARSAQAGLGAAVAAALEAWSRAGLLESVVSRLFSSDGRRR